MPNPTPNAVSAVLRRGDVLKIGPISFSEENGWITVARCGALVARLSSCRVCGDDGRPSGRHVNGFPYGEGGEVLPELIRAKPEGELPLTILGPGGAFRKAVLP